jgi:hypothetical protein
MPRGVYGSTSSSATYKDAHFSGAGTVTVPARITITNTPATAITSSAAALNATLACGGTNAAVLAYWNTVNGGTNAATWTNSAYVGAWTNVVSTNLSRTVTGLAPNTTYYFTFRGTNAGGSVWATNVRSFTTLTPPAPSVANAPGATNLSAGVAQLRGTLTNGPADVRLYWGTTDGGTNKGNWANTNLLVNAPGGSFSSNVSNLLYGLTYHYRSYASNQWGAAWASATTNFTTLRPNSTLANSAASGITSNAAALNATLACTGAVYQVSAFWNTADGGTNAALWTNSAYVGSWTNVVSTNLSYTATGLLPSTTYAFSFRATNALNTLWATNALSFTTLALPAPVVVLSSPTNGQQFVGTASIPLAASVTANGHTLSQVNYYDGASQVGTSGTGPNYSATWSGVVAGSYSLTAVAVYDGSLTVTSAPPVGIVVLGSPTLIGFGPLSGTSFPLTFSGPSGQTYKVLSSTNVALPMASWTVLSSGSFGATLVTYTDTSATNKQQFYRVQSP